MIQLNTWNVANDTTILSARAAFWSPLASKAFDTLSTKVNPHYPEDHFLEKILESAAFVTSTPKSTALISFNEPPKLPKADLSPPRIKTCSMKPESHKFT